MARNGHHPGSGRCGGANGCVRLDAVLHEPRQVGQRLDVVHDGWLAVQPDSGGKERRLQPGHATVAFQAFDQRRLFADNVRSGAPVQHDVDTEVGAKNVFADVSGRVRIVQGNCNALLGNRHFAAYVQKALRESRGIAGNQTTFDQLVRVALHEQAILIGARLAFVAIDHEVARPHILRCETPFDTSRKAGAATAKDGCALDPIVNFGRLHGDGLAQALVTTGCVVSVKGEAVIELEAGCDNSWTVTGDKARRMRIGGTGQCHF